MEGIKKFLSDNGLVLFMMSLFAIFLIGTAATGFQNNNEDLEEHQQPTITISEYLKDGEFLEAVFENWESEFLQMGALVIATIFLKQKGSADSKKLRGKNEVDTSSRYSIINATTTANRGKAIKDLFYSNSLSLALMGLFVFSFTFHAISGTAAYNEEAQFHGQEQISSTTYVQTSQFWFESFQNWQSEFLAVGTLLYLSIYLRQRGSPESKPIGEPNNKTGS
jgi:hypothetical protein